MRWEGLDGDGARQGKLLFCLPFFRKIFLNPDKILISLIVNSSLKAKEDKNIDSQAKTNEYEYEYVCILNKILK
jgi:hypothetical protein